MTSPPPASLKFVKDFPRPVMTFGVGRLRGTSRVFLGGSDFAVVEVDTSAAKLEARELYKHDSYVTGVTLSGTSLVSGGYDGKLRWYDVAASKLLRYSA